MEVKFGVFQIDRTFNLRELAFTQQNQRSVVSNGRINNDSSKIRIAYRGFASFMASPKPKFKSIKAFVTDDEANLYNAFKDEHANSRNRLCFVHFKNNVKDHLYKIGADEANMRLILSDLFGEQIGTRLHVVRAASLKFVGTDC